VSHHDAGRRVDHFADAAVVPEVNLSVWSVGWDGYMMGNVVVDESGGDGLTSLPQTPT
jgi:hypothetical protein